MNTLFTVKFVDKTIEVIDFNMEHNLIDLSCNDRDGNYVPISFATRAYVIQELALLYLQGIRDKELKR